MMFSNADVGPLVAFADHRRPRPIPRGGGSPLGPSVVSAKGDYDNVTEELCVLAVGGSEAKKRFCVLKVDLQFRAPLTNHLEERLLDQAQAWTPYTPLLGGRSRSIPQGMILDVQWIFFYFEASIPLKQDTTFGGGGVRSLCSGGFEPGSGKKE